MLLESKIKLKLIGYLELGRGDFFFFFNLLLWSGKYSFGRLFLKKLLERKYCLKMSNLKLLPGPGVLVKEVIKEVGPCLWFW